MHDNHAIQMTLIEPGMVDTPFFDNRPGDWALRDEDIARAVALRARAAATGSTSTRS